MKVSKLFHWLYAILMLLPVFFIGGRVLYTVFNKNAKDSYSAQQSEVLEVNNLSDMKVGTEYSISNFYINSESAYSNIQFICDELDFNQNHYEGYINLVLWKNSGNTTTYVNISVNGTAVVTTQNTVNTTLKFKYQSTTLSQALYNYFSKKFNYTAIYYDNTLDNAFSYSVEQLNENRLFSWASDSFLNEPFQYITGLFGIAADNPINTLLSYWLSISIIWLVFDLIIYVPLLVHRWIDKGVLE